MVLTYQEAVEVGARALADRYGEDVVDVDRQNCAAVLEAVGYADLLAECRDAWRMFEAAEDQRDEARNERDQESFEVNRLQDLSNLWQSVVSAESFEAAVNVMAQAYHETECAYRTERDALVATVARVEALIASHWGPGGRVPVETLDDALHPKRTDASSQWVLDCTLGEDGAR